VQLHQFRQSGRHVVAPEARTRGDPQCATDFPLALLQGGVAYCGGITLPSGFAPAVRYAC
jgi:hypothetical protein